MQHQVARRASGLPALGGSARHFRGRMDIGGATSSKEPAYRALVQSRSMPWILGFIFPAAFLLVAAAVIVPLLAPALGPAPIFIAVAAVFAVIAGVLLESMSRVTVGADGILIRRRLGKQFIPFSRLADAAEVDGVAIRFFLKGGGYIDLYTGKDEQLTKPRYVQACEELLSRVRDGLSQYRVRSGADEGIADGLRDKASRALRGDAPVARAAYREAPAPTRDELLRVIDADAAPASSRAAAAVLLRGRSDEATRARVRVVAEATADPALRRLFRVAADDTSDDADVQEAFGHVGDAPKSLQNRA